MVVVTKVATQDSSQVALVEDDHMVETFAPNGTDDTLDIQILPRGTRCYENLLDTKSIDAARAKSTD